MQFTKIERERYNIMRKKICENLHITEAQYNSFRLTGKKLISILTAECNGELDVEEAAKQFDTLGARAVRLADQLGLSIYFQTDPRGATVYFCEKSIVMDEINYSQIGACIL
jgi:hypothetical protein